MEARENKPAEELAELVAQKLSARFGACGFTPAEQEAVKDLLRTKRNAVRAFLWICGAVMLWVLKDVYVYIAGHLTFR
ncbi:MAG TPA: hypothetical protein DDW94_05290 [Deltaproteobacteria bacterium]|nr:MAG: hypothetical protein A2Z79_04665 [Deltaproteobacteria bacterium GWA2_55_82]OGQ61973.1 MAG: hypothetical protein A3I81_13190 [Deltaproteobacteria bacterium RIFCSPLOWO2_02_FULL_55_12]OIJ74668.1 MAG: hypothetical protein A2V21_310575 [Deltaproteobacteria bacterium GWC2_55_46]HBG46388.1 hypothetical protein [Deltaproteobacteria bacterium]HCY10599.1 hypothetical protein [Deltaproteobacteria bacterium]